MLKNITIVFVFCLASYSLMAQGHIESPYSRFGIGDLSDNTSVRNLGMGGLSIAVPSPGYINYYNPASLSYIDSLSFIFDFGINGGIRNYQIDNPPMTSTRSDIQISHLLFGFRITDWWTTGFGAMPYSNVAYDIATYDSLAFDVNKYYRFAGNGGINRVFWANSISPINNLSLGVKMSYLFGNIYQNSGINFDDDSGAYLNTLQRNSISVSDFMFDFGIKYSFDINSNTRIHIGGIYNYNSHISGNQSTMIFNSLSSGGSAIIDTIYNTLDIPGTITIPQKYGFGITLERNERLLIGFDYSTQNWSEAEFFGQADSLNNSNNFIFGLEYTPIGRTGFAHRYSQTVSYRLGAYFNNTYLNLNPNGDPLNDFGISFGLGLPVKRSQTSLNLSLQVGQRGTVLNDLVKENYIIFAVSFNLVDRWFVKRRFE